MSAYGSIGSLRPPERGEQLAVRRGRADPDVHPAAGERVDGAEVLGEAERRLVPERHDVGLEPDRLGALARRGQEREGGGDAALQMPLPDAGDVEAELLTEGEQPQRLLEPDLGPAVGVVPGEDESCAGNQPARHRASFQAVTSDSSRESAPSVTPCTLGLRAEDRRQLVHGDLVVLARRSAPARRRGSSARAAGSPSASWAWSSVSSSGSSMSELGRGLRELSCAGRRRRRASSCPTRCRSLRPPAWRGSPARRCRESSSSMPTCLSCCWISSRLVWLGPKFVIQISSSESRSPSFSRMPSSPGSHPASSSRSAAASASNPKYEL